MTISKLANLGFMPASHYSSGRDGHTVTKFTPHYMAGNLSCKGCVDCWIDRNASSNYGIDSEGNIACYVEEQNRAWTSSSYSNDIRAITVEVANLDNSTGEISDKAWQSLVKLATDICHRYNFRLNYTGTPFGSLTMHKMFSATSCPGPWIESHMEELAETVNHNLDTGNFSYSGVASDSLSKGLAFNDPAVAYAAGIRGKVLFSQEEIYPFVISIDNNTSDIIDFKKLKESDVIGVCIDMGSYFTENHSVSTVFRSSKLEKQFKEFKANGFTIGLSTTLRSRNREEALKELYEIRLTVLKYPPDMGLWLKPTFYSDNKETNDKLIKIYYDVLVKLGFIDQVGFYCKKDELEKFNWENVCEDWYWWIDRHLNNIEKIHCLPKPNFFFYENPEDEDGLIEPNFEKLSSLKISSNSSSSYDNSKYNSYQKAVADAAESGENCCTQQGLCAQFITDVFVQARKTKPSIQVPYGNAIDYWTNWSDSGSTDRNPPVGSIVVGSGSPYDSPTTNPYGHVGVVLPGGRIADNIGYHCISDSLDSWLSWQTATCKGYRGYIGWVWANGQDLSKLGD